MHPNTYSDDEHSEAEEILDETEFDQDLNEDDNGILTDDEDLFGDNMERDYIPNPELDRMDEDLVNDDEIDTGISAGARARADQEIRERERINNDNNANPTNASRHYSNLMNLLNEVDEDNTNEATQGRDATRATRVRRRRLDTIQRSGVPSSADATAAREELPFYDKELGWDTRLEGIFKTLFQDFIWNYSATLDEEREFVGDYTELLIHVVKENLFSLPIKYGDIIKYLYKFTEWFFNFPIQLFDIFNQVIKEITDTNYRGLYKDRYVKARFVGFGGLIEPLSNLKVDTLHQLVAIEGVVVRRSVALPRVKELYIDCKRCGEIIGPIESREDAWKSVRTKRICPRAECNSDGPFGLFRERTVYESYQYLSVQELSHKVAPGRVPRQKDVVVEGDLVDYVRPGDMIQLIAYHEHKRDAMTNARNGFPIVLGQLVANNVIKRSEMKLDEITEEDIALFHRLAENPNIRERLIRSIAPSIWGCRHAKTGLAMALFGGVRREGTSSDKHSIRGDINVLLLGDPGMAKSQFLKYVNGLLEKSVYTTGKGASSSGLTASMKKDPITGEYTLEGGALVLADNGICLIDEFDKMSEQDRVSIHEAMESQSISISKAGICTSLRARCSVIAAANPQYGRYDSSLTFSENVTLGDTILSRFDVLAVMKDVPTLVQDEHLAHYILGNHKQSHPDVQSLNQFGVEGNDEDANGDPSALIGKNSPIPHEILAKYILYARKKFKPMIRPSDEHKVTEFYAQVRQSSKYAGGLSLTVRHLESILRMSMANAKMRLSNVVDRSDIDFAISTMLESFIQSQKHAVATTLGNKFGRYRALASSPYELIEGILIETLNTFGSRALRERMSTDHRADITISDRTLLLDQPVPLDTLVFLCDNQYSIPKSAVEKFVNCSRFRNRFTITRGPKGEKEILFKPNDERGEDDIINATQVVL